MAFTVAIDSKGTTMGNECLENCQAIDTDDGAFKEKTRIAEVATATLCKLNTIMKRMKDWQEDRAKLKCNIWRLKLALRAAGSETDESLETDPLIEYQRKQIKLSMHRDTACVASSKFVDVKKEYLEENERLNNEIVHLRKKLEETGEGTLIEHLRCKLREFIIGDQTMEIVFANMVSKVAETVANLSEALVNLTEDLYKSKMKNDSLFNEVDKLRALLRSRDGKNLDYRKRIDELECITKQLQGETAKFKDNFRNEFYWESFDYRSALINAERLTNELKDKLKNDHEALLAAGDSESLKYMKNIIHLRVNLKYFYLELKDSSLKGYLRSCKETDDKKYLRKISSLEDSLKQIDMEINKLAEDRVVKHHEVNGVEGLTYLRKIEELRRVVDDTRTTINYILKYSYLGKNKSEMAKDFGVERFEDLIRKICQKIKELEMIVMSSDSSSSSKRIEELEETVVRLKVELTETEDRANSLGEKFLHASTVLDEQKKKIMEAENKNDMLTRANERLRNLLRERDEQIGSLVSWKETTEERMKTEITSLKMKLEITSKADEESGYEKCEIQNESSSDFIRFDKESGDTKCYLESAQNNSTDIPGVEMASDNSEKNACDVNREIIELVNKLERVFGEKVEQETSLSDSSKEVLVYQSAGITIEERIRKLARQISRCNMTRLEEPILRKENGRLKIELIRSQCVEEDIKKKYSKLENEFHKSKSEYYSTRERVKNFESNMADLRTTLASTMSELEQARNEIKCSRTENARLKENLDCLTLKNTGVDARLQVVLTEKNDLATRINELNEENVALKVQLNKVRTENEYFSIELNKSRIEYERAISRNSVLEDATREMSGNNALLEKTNHELRIRINVIQAEYNVLENQRNILETRNETMRKEKESLYRENDDLKGYIDNVNVDSNVKCAIGKNPKDDEKMDDRRVKVSREKSRKSDDKVKIKDKDGRMSLRVENEALKLELMNLRRENSKVRLELSRTKDEFEKLRIELTKDKANENTVMPISNKFEIVNLYYRREPNNYSGNYSEEALCSSRNLDNYWSTTFNGWIQGNINFRESNDEMISQFHQLLRIIDKLKIENIALRMEMHTLLCNVDVNCTGDKKMENELKNAVEETRALKMELMTLRDENESLRMKLNTARSELDKSTFERVALKEELIILRKTNSELRAKADDLRDDYLKSKEINLKLENDLSLAVKEIHKCTINIGNSIGDEFGDFLHKCIPKKDSTHLENELLKAASTELINSTEE